MSRYSVSSLSHSCISLNYLLSFFPFDPFHHFFPEFKKKKRKRRIQYLLFFINLVNTCTHPVLEKRKKCIMTCIYKLINIFIMQVRNQIKCKILNMEWIKVAIPTEMQKVATATSIFISVLL